MITRSPKQQSIMLAGLLIALLVTTPAFAATVRRQTAGLNRRSRRRNPSLEANAHTATSADDGSGTARYSQCEVAKQLRNVAPLPFGAPEDKLPIAQLKLPKGFKVEVYAGGIPNARSLRLGDKGTVFVSNRVLDKVYAIVEKNGKREIRVIASGLDRPNGLAFHKGVLYIAEGTKISKLENIEDNLENPPKPVVIYSGLPKSPIARLEV